MAESARSSFVSTGSLPSPAIVRAELEEAHARFQGNRDGECSAVYPALARVDPDLFGLCVVGTSGRSYAVGDAEHPLTIMSVAKPFVFALVAEVLGPDGVHARVGANATGLAFNSAEALERQASGRTNPMVNAGALVTASLVPGAGLEDRWDFICRGLSAFAGRDLSLDEEVLESALRTHHRNHGLTWLLEGLGQLESDPRSTIELYTRQSSLSITARDLAVMGATLADGGVNPITNKRVVAPNVCHYALAVMATAGMYETSGDWLYHVGVPGKSGIGGGIVTVAPGKGALGTFAPRLDEAGNSIKGQLAALFLAKRLGLSLFASRPHPQSVTRTSTSRQREAP